MAMSTTAEVQDLDVLKQTIADVRADEAGNDRKAWVLVGHVDNKPGLVDVVADDASSAEASLDDFRSKLEDDQVMYGLIRLTTSIDMSTTVKFIYVHWVGDAVPFAKKGRFGVVHGSVEEHFNPYHMQVETSNRDDLEESEIINKLEDSSFTRSKVLSYDQIDGRQERGFLAHQVKRRSQNAARSVAPAGAAIDVAPELEEFISEVRDDTSGTRWVAATFEAQNFKKPLILVAKGEGDLEELREHFDDEQVMFALYRTSDVYDDITTVKFVYILWVGDKVKPMAKGKVSTISGPVENFFSPHHVCLRFTNVYEIEEAIIKDKVMASSGSKSFVK